MSSYVHVGYLWNILISSSDAEGRKEEGAEENAGGLVSCGDGGRP